MKNSFKMYSLRPFIQDEKTVTDLGFLGGFSKKKCISKLSGPTTKALFLPKQLRRWRVIARVYQKIAFLVNPLRM